MPQSQMLPASANRVAQAEDQIVSAMGEPIGVDGIGACGSPRTAGAAP